MNPQNTPPVPAPVSNKPASLPPQPPHRHRSRHLFLGEVFSTISILVAALAIALLLIAFVFQSYAVSGPSMENTLQNNDRLIVWKVPRTWARITHHTYIPKRGDVIIFQQTGLAQFGQADSRQLVKRVIGLPGDHIVIKNGKITIYNKANPKGFDPDTTLPYGAKLTYPYTSGNIDITLSTDQLFVCGDHRTDSLDSRAFGPINADQIVGKLVARILPLSDAKRF